MRSPSNSDWMRAREAGSRYTRPSDTLPMPLLTQEGNTPLVLARSAEVKAVFAELVEHTVITDDNKNALLLDCARLGLVSRLRAVLQAGGNAAHADEVRVRA